MKDSDKPQTVFVIDDDPSFRKLLSTSLIAEGFLVDSYDSAQSFLDDFNSDHRGCALIDLAMPHMKGAELQTQMLARGILMPVIFLTATADVTTTATVMRQGAMDLIEKPSDTATLAGRLREAFENDTLLANSRKVRRSYEKALAELTPRERQVMDLAVVGLANKQVGMKLSISERTVEIHRSRVMKKMLVDSFADLVSRHTFFTHAA